MPTVDITYKICTRCNQTRDVLLFHMKNKTKRKSHCRFCTSSFPRSDYNYPTKKQQELAQQNLKILTISFCYLKFILLMKLITNFKVYQNESSLINIIFLMKIHIKI